MRLAFQELGPTFIKLGQLIANRPDLFPAEYVDEFGKLESRVEPVDFTEIHQKLARSLGRDPDECFAEIDSTPLATASIAQIHRARLHDGTEVILKVQKPGTRQIVERDLEILSIVAQALSGNEELEYLDLSGLVAEIERAFERELNYTFERNALERVRANFADDPTLVVPRTYSEFSSKTLLVMEYLDGISLRDATVTPAEGERIARECARILFEMIFRDGYFHGDPHASNIMLLTDGRLAWVDFGSMGLLTDEMRLRLVKLLRAMTKRNYDAVARQVLKLGRPKGELSIFEFSVDIATRIDPFFGLTVDELDVSDVFTTILELARDHRVQIAPNFITMTRCLVLIEGVTSLLSPGFNTMAEVEPLVRKHLLERYRPDRLAEDTAERIYDTLSAVAEYPAHISEILRRLAQGKLQVDTHLQGLEQFSRRAESNTNHIVQALIVSSLLVSSSLVMLTEVGPVIWGVPVLGLLGYTGAGLLGFWMVISIIRR